MKPFRLLPVSLVALIMSIGVTAGSLYVTVDAALRRATSEPVGPLTMVTGIASDATMVEVPLTAGGGLKARFSAISTPSGVLLPSSDLDVVLIAANGRRIQEATDADGVCSFVGLKPGLYTITAMGVQGRVSYGVRLTAADQPLAGRNSGHKWVPVTVGLDVVLDSALTPARDSDAIDRIIDSVTVTPVEFAETAARSHSSQAVPAQFDVAQEDSTYTGHEPIQLNGNGSLDGQVGMLDPVTGQSTPISDLTVSFITENRVVAETRVNPDGSFVQANLLPGVYSMVVAGKDGIGYMGVDVIGNLAAVERPEAVIPVRMAARAGLAFGMLQGAGASGTGAESESGSDESDDTDESNDVAESEDQTPDEPSRQSPAAAASGSGGFAIGGGVPGSGGGLGTALGLAGGAAAALLASDDDDGRPASPAR